jgi:predicted lipoprotein with Yx(FWY)xxD motif
MSITTVFRSRLSRIGLSVAAAGILAAGAAGAAMASSTPPPVPSSASTSASTVMVSGGHLTDGTGRTVYLWVADSAGMSNCMSACASVWPPVPSTGTSTAGPGIDATKLSTIMRADGTKQLAYGGHALYYFAADKAPGQTTGQGSDSFGAKWWEVSPAGQAITSTSGSTATAPSMRGAY